MAHHVSTPPEVQTPYRTPRSGWLVFAAVMFFVAAGANALYGIAALADDDYFRADELLFGDLTMWGIIYLGIAVLQLILALSILGRRTFGMFVASTLVTIHALVALVSIGAYPLWTVIVLAIDALILYALTVHGGDEQW
jgi:hypothetical protein